MKTLYTPGRSDDLIASYSSKGPTLIDGVVKPDLVAPGNLIKSLSAGRHSTLYRAAPGNAAGEYFQLSGTSMATAVVSGSAALLLEKEPHLSPDQVKVRLMKTATKSFPDGSVVVMRPPAELPESVRSVFTIGACYLDIMAARNHGLYGIRTGDLAVGGSRRFWRRPRNTFACLRLDLDRRTVRRMGNPRIPNHRRVGGLGLLRGLGFVGCLG